MVVLRSNSVYLYNSEILSMLSGISDRHIDPFDAELLMDVVVLFSPKSNLRKQQVLVLN